VFFLLAYCYLPNVFPAFLSAVICFWVCGWVSVWRPGLWYGAGIHVWILQQQTYCSLWHSDFSGEHSLVIHWLLQSTFCWLEPWGLSLGGFTFHMQLVIWMSFYWTLQVQQQPYLTWVCHFLLQCKNEDEVVAVIAHELGHWKLSHTTYSFLAMQVLLIPLPMLALSRSLLCGRVIYILEGYPMGTTWFLRHSGHHCKYPASVLPDVHYSRIYIFVLHDILMWVYWLAKCSGMTFH
jgi:hypothetical protein